MMVRDGTIFLHCGFRTGGTAIAQEFRKNPNYKLFYDPFNPAIFFETELNSNTWPSNHPRNMDYFLEYADIKTTLNKNIKKKIWELRFDFFGENFQELYTEYIQKLVVLANSEKKIAVFKFETSEGRIPLLKHSFPNSLHVGVVRDIKKQEDSWLEQFALGLNGFHLSALKIINSSPFRFQQQDKISFHTKYEKLSEIFYTYENNRRKLLSEADVILDLDNRESIEETSKIINEYLIDKHNLDVDVPTFNSDNEWTTEHKLKRLIESYIRYRHQTRFPFGWALKHRQNPLWRVSSKLMKHFRKIDLQILIKHKRGH